MCAAAESTEPECMCAVDDFHTLFFLFFNLLLLLRRQYVTIRFLVLVLVCVFYSLAPPDEIIALDSINDYN